MCWLVKLCFRKEKLQVFKKCNSRIPAYEQTYLSVIFFILYKVVVNDKKADCFHLKKFFFS